MKLLDSDILGILLALMTFIVPAISGILEKKRKEKKRKEAALDVEVEELPEQPCREENENSVEAQKLNDEIQELFDVLIGKGAHVEKNEEPVEGEEEILPHSSTPAADELQPVPEEVEENVVLQTEPETLQEVPAAQEGNSLNKRIKDNPKEAIILAEILAPKFKEYN